MSDVNNTIYGGALVTPPPLDRKMDWFGDVSVLDDIIEVGFDTGVIFQAPMASLFLGADAKLASNGTVELFGVAGLVFETDESKYTELRGGAGRVFGVAAPVTEPTEDISEDMIPTQAVNKAYVEYMLDKAPHVYVRNYIEVEEVFIGSLYAYDVPDSDELIESATGDILLDPARYSAYLIVRAEGNQLILIELSNYMLAAAINEAKLSKPSTPGHGGQYLQCTSDGNTTWADIDAVSADDVDNAIARSVGDINEALEAVLNGGN